MSQTLQALNGRVIVEPIVEETTKAGLLVQASQDLKVARGKIVNVSTLIWNEFESRLVQLQAGDVFEQICYPNPLVIRDAGIKHYVMKERHHLDVNDIVFYEKMSAFEIKLDNKTYHIVDRRSVLAILRETI